MKPFIEGDYHRKLLRQAHHKVLAIIMVMLFILTVEIAGIFMGDDDPVGDFSEMLVREEFLPIWIFMLANQVSPQLPKWASIFSLFVHYRGGRSGQQFFNDRTIGHQIYQLFELSRRLSAIEAVFFVF
jgi:hypothetical protein